MGDVAKLGGVSLVLVGIEIAVSLSFMTALGRAFKLKPKLTDLLAVGSSICGVSAIIAAQGAIDADDEDASYAIAAILSLGAISLFIFPLVGHALHLSDTSYGLWAGLGIDNTAEVTAAGALYSDAAAKVAVLAKTARNAMIGFVVLAYAIRWARKENTAGVTNKAQFLWQKFPKFVLGFLAISAIATAHVFSNDQLDKPSQSLPLGLPTHVRRSRPTHQHPRTRQTRLPPLLRGRPRRNSDRSPDARPGLRRRPLPRISLWNIPSCPPFRPAGGRSGGSVLFFRSSS